MKPSGLKNAASLMLGLLCLAWSLLGSGCVHANKVRIGRLPSNLDFEGSLNRHVSTPQDVLAVLGSPYGRGRAMFPFDKKPKTMWTYYYEKGISKEDFRTLFLFIYFDEDRYDGYMWFSSLGSAASLADRTMH